MSHRVMIKKKIPRIKSGLKSLKKNLSESVNTRYGGKLIVLGIIVVSFILVAGSIYFFGPDKFIEEKAEEIIKEKTGLDLDLTPSSPEIKEIIQKAFPNSPLVPPRPF